MVTLKMRATTYRNFLVKIKLYNRFYFGEIIFLLFNNQMRINSKEGDLLWISFHDENIYSLKQ